MLVDVALIPTHPVLPLLYYSIHVMAAGTELVSPATHDLSGFIHQDTSACFFQHYIGYGFFFATAIPNNVFFPFFYDKHTKCI